MTTDGAKDFMPKVDWAKVEEAINYLRPRFLEKWHAAIEFAKQDRTWNGRRDTSLAIAGLSRYAGPYDEQAKRIAPILVDVSSPSVTVGLDWASDFLVRDAHQWIRKMREHDRIVVYSDAPDVLPCTEDYSADVKFIWRMRGALDAGNCICGIHRSRCDYHGSDR